MENNKKNRLDRVVHRNKKYLVLDVVLTAMIVSGLTASALALRAELPKLSPGRATASAPSPAALHDDTTAPRSDRTWIALN